MVNLFQFFSYTKIRLFINEIPVIIRPLMEVRGGEFFEIIFIRSK